MDLLIYQNIGDILEEKKKLAHIIIFLPLPPCYTDLTLSEDLPADENDKSCSDSSDCNGELIQRRLFSF
jgi:hypothetical protein